MQIAMITPWNVKCGIFTYTRNLVNAIVNLEHEVYIIKLPRFGAKTPATLQNVVDSIPAEKIDIIHVQEEYGLYRNLEKSFFPALKALGKPIVTTMHAIGNWPLDQAVATASDKVIVHNKFCQERFAGESIIIRHGATPLKTPPPPKIECKKSLGIAPKARVVGYLGFISSYKGLETLIQAMTKIAKVGLLIGGGWHVEHETEYIFRLKESSLRLLPKRCRWLGYVSDEDMPKVYASMDIVVYPSRFATESGALIMALSHEKAVIANALKPFIEKEKEGALTTFKRDDPDSLAQKIKKLLRNKQLRHELEKGAKKYCEKYSWSNVAKQHVKLYQDILRI